MTNSIDLKFVFFKYLISSRKTIIIDDLSYNHENGEVFFYHNIINHLEKNKMYFLESVNCDKFFTRNFFLYEKIFYIFPLISL